MQLNGFLNNKRTAIKKIVTFRVLILVFSLFISCETAIVSEQIFLDSSLEYGEYAVGFKSLFPQDLSREDVYYSDWDGKLYNEGQKLLKGRSIPLHIWYPAEKSNNYIEFEHFIHLMPQKTIEGFKPSQDAIAEQIFINQTNALKGDSLFSRAELSNFKKLMTKSSSRAKPINERFPLILYPNGTSPAYQSIICEYLASNGYVVVALPLKGRYTHVLDASVRGLEMAVDDLEFALQQLLSLPNVDSEGIALLANAIESSFSVGLASRNKKIKAVISLDGGLLSQFEQDILKETEFYSPEDITVPILSIYSDHPLISPKQLEYLEYSDRYFAHFPTMSEFYFLNYGVLEQYVPNIIGETKGNVKLGHNHAAELSLYFLNSKLKGLKKPWDTFFSENNSRFQETIDSTFYKKGLNPTPNLAILKNLFLQQGIDAIDSVYTSHRNQGNKQPFSTNFYKDFRDWLAWKKDPDFSNRKKLFAMATESHPESSLMRYYRARYLHNTGEVKLARQAYIKTIELLNSDTSIDQDFKNAIREASKNALNDF